MAVHLPAEHGDPSIDVLRPYIHGVVVALVAQGVDVVNAWLDPVGPRDATVLARIDGELQGLVWDEETGWRRGLFRHGHPGERTRLAEVSYLGGGLAPEPLEVVDRLRTGTRESRRVYREHSDLPERLPDLLNVPGQVA